MKTPPLNKKIGIARCILLCLAFGAATPAFAATYYIAKNGNDGNGGSATSPWATMAKAMSVVTNGVANTIIVRNSTSAYTEQFNITKSGGSMTAQLVIKAESPLGVTINATGNTNGFHITGNYVKVDGFKVKNANGGGIFIDAAHHVTVTNCESFDNQGAGIYGARSDYLWIDRNHVYNNAWGGNIVTSGISIHHPVNITGNTNTTTPRILIRWNVVHENHQEVNNPTDGAGIILDDLRCKQTLTWMNPLPDYTFPALIEGNLTYLNGGPGIKLYSNKNVTVRNNTAFKNNRDRTNSQTQTWVAEISIINCDNVNVVNNIAASDLLNSNMTAFANIVQNNDTKTDDNDNIVWKNNLLYNYQGNYGGPTPGTKIVGFSPPAATYPTTGSPHYNKINVTPGFIDASVADGDPYDFRLTTGSNSRNAGTDALGIAATDLDNNTRLMGSTVDIGCYERVE